MKFTTAYPTIWRWHFYAGLFVLPFVLILSVTGAIYLFKPQIERWEERAWIGMGTAGAVSADRQLAAVQAAYPGARFDQYRLPRQPGDAAMIQMGMADGSARQIFVSPQGKVVGSLIAEGRIADLVGRIHGSLLLGTWGDRLVELAASWTIVMMLTGLYLWWPRPFRAAGTLWPRLSLKGRPLLKDLHRVTGFWIAGLMLVMLASGLPWAGTWGSAFRWVRTEMGWVKGPENWKVGAGDAHGEGGHGGGHHGAHHDMATMDMPMDMPMPAAPLLPSLPLSAFVAKAAAADMAFPVLVLPPHAPQRFGPPTGDVWTVKSEAQNRTLDRQISYAPSSGAETGRSGFADQHMVDRIVNVGVAWHEGQLFGLANQLIGLATAVALIAISLLGVVMWVKRRPQGGSGMGAPPRQPDAPMRGLALLMLVSGLLLPLLGVSLLMVWLIDRVVRRFVPTS